MPELSANENHKCDYCGREARYVSVNSKKYRCTEKVTQCPGVIKKQNASRLKNIDSETRRKNAKKANRAALSRIADLSEDAEWVEKKGRNISAALAGRGGHSGEKNPMYGKKHSETTIEKLRQKASSRDPECYKLATDTKISNGIAVDKSLKSDWENYRDQVANFTYQSWVHYQDIVNPQSFPRGNEYELDHKFSITEGFRQSIPPEIIGSPANLEMIPKAKNRSKRTQCSIELEVLLLESKKFL